MEKGWHTYVLKDLNVHYPIFPIKQMCYSGKKEKGKLLMGTINRKSIIEKVYEELMLYRKYKYMNKAKSNITTQVNSILDRMEDSKDELSWFCERATEGVLVELIVSWILADHDNRNIMHNLKYKGMRYNYTSLIGNVKTAEHYVKSEKIKNELENITLFYTETESLWNPMSKYYELKKILSFCRERITVEEVIQIMKKTNDSIRENLQSEKKSATVLGIESFNYKRVTQYIAVTELMLIDLLHISIAKKYGEQQYRLLRNCTLFMERVAEEVENQISNLKEKPYQFFVVNEEGKISSPISQAFVLKKQYEAYCDELKKIEEVLEMEIANNKQHFFDHRLIRYKNQRQYTSRRDLILDLKESEKIGGDDYNKLKKTKKYIDFCNERGEHLGENTNLILLRAVYQEVFMNKTKLPDKNRDFTAATIVEMRMGNEKVENRHEIFVEKKIQRGIFREYRLIEEYIGLNKVNRKYREIMKKIFELPDDISMYNMIRKVFEEVISIVGLMYE